MQVFADQHGRCIHLGERDCTAQRRRQKLIEEAPSPVVSPAMREALGRSAVAAAMAVGYVGAGTVEFIVDAGLQHHFLEMNTRLQVEHTVTECITGLDLVEWQLRVARGEPLPLTQAQVRFEGHAIEVRLVAEDPYDAWKPQTGRVLGWRPEQARLRVDHGLAEGDEVSPWYDAMVAKFIAHGSSRDDAIRRLVRALQDAPLLGVAHNAHVLAGLLRHPAFVAAQMHTTSLDDWAQAGEPLLQRPAPPEAAWRLAAALRAPAAGTRPPGVAQRDVLLHCQGDTRTLRAPPPGVELLGQADGEQRFRIDGVLRRCRVAHDGDTLHIGMDGTVFVFTAVSPWPSVQAATDPGRALAPVAGVVAQVNVAVGDGVTAGQPLVCVEAMKMEMWLHAGAAGTVRALHVKAKDAVAAGAVLVEIELSASQTA